MMLMLSLILLLVEVLIKKKLIKKVSEAIKILKNKDVLVYNKRIDSTLRGNIGTEINAMLDNLEDDRIAVVIPSYPDSGRIVVNKTMLVNGSFIRKFRCWKRS